MKSTPRLFTFLFIPIALLGKAHAQDVDFCAVAVPGEVFCDDFSDGDATDGDPVSWSTLFGGTLAVADDSLVITHSTPDFPASQVVPPATYTDISLRAQVRLLEGDSIGFAARRGGGSSYGGFIQNDEALIGIGGSGQILARSDLTLDVKNEDVLLQFDVIGDRLKFWAWPAGEEMPTEPAVSAVNNLRQDGEFFIWAAQIDPGGSSGPSGAFRFVQVATQSIPEPSSGALLGIGLAGLGTMRKRRRDTLRRVSRLGCNLR